MGNKRGLWVNEHTFVEFNHNTTAPLSQEIASRGRSIDFYNLGMYLPNPDPVLKKMGKDIQVYRELLSDAHVGACVINRKAGVKSLNWSIDRGKARSRQAKIIEDVFKGLDIERITGEILNAPLFGNQPLEVMWEQSGKYWLPKDIVGKPQRWFVYDEDNKPRFLTKTNMTLGEFKSARLPSYCACEGAFFMPEKFTLYQALRHCSAVHLYQRLVFSLALIVDCSSYKFLPRAAFSEYENG